MSDTIQIFEIYIKAPPQKIWDAITSPEWTAKYGYQGRAEFDLRPGGVARHHANFHMRVGEARGLRREDYIAE